MKLCLFTTRFTSLWFAGIAHAVTFDGIGAFLAGNDIAFTETFSSLGNEKRTFDGPLFLATGLSI